MAHTREARLNTLIERSSVGEGYFIYDPDNGKQEFEPDTPDWFRWLAGRTSLHFKGKCGHFTARQEEKKKRDEEQPSSWYWYAYRKAYGVKAGGITSRLRSGRPGKTNSKEQNSEMPTNKRRPNCARIK